MGARVHPSEFVFQKSRPISSDFWGIQTHDGEHRFAWAPWSILFLPQCFFPVITSQNIGNHGQRLEELEQLERLRSEDTPAASWLPILLTHTDPKSKEDNVKVTNLKNLTKLQIFEFWNKLYTLHTFWSCLIRCTNMKWIRRVLVQIQSGHDSVHRRTDRQGETSIPPPFQLRWSRGIKCVPVRCSGRNMMTSSNGTIFCVTGHLCGEFTGPQWIPRTKASDAELWCFLWSAPE